eukprot:TRINITY_DN67510_c5_g9_i1.p1 TRINITY_DN67510_c5_g9~~TRINITY_DN67510_c5_g9_i1.p1  ORF type:complete len:737 (-),score=43.91 TRINITY_DN67510_c5_g9_i1:232-2442(-)
MAVRLPLAVLLLTTVIIFLLCSNLSAVIINTVLAKKQVNHLGDQVRAQIANRIRSDLHLKLGLVPRFFEQGRDFMGASGIDPLQWNGLVNMTYFIRSFLTTFPPEARCCSAMFSYKIGRFIVVLVRPGGVDFWWSNTTAASTDIAEVDTFGAQFTADGKMPELKCPKLPPKEENPCALGLVPWTRNDGPTPFWFDMTAKMQPGEFSFTPTHIWPLDEVQLKVLGVTPLHENPLPVTRVPSGSWILGFKLGHLSAELANMSDFTGFMYLVETYDNTLVACSDADVPLMNDDKTAKLDPAESGNQLISVSAKKIGETCQWGECTGEESCVVNVDGETYFVSTFRYYEYGVKWVGVVLIPRHELMSEVDKSFRLTVILCSIIIVTTTILLILFVTCMVSRPLVRMKNAMKSISKLDLDVEDNSSGALITEIQGMHESFDCMLNGLRSFEKYVPTDVIVGFLATDKPELGVEKKTITVGFMDIVGFTTLAESLDPQVLVEVVGHFLEEISMVFASNHGTIDKYIGDCVMCLWGAPTPIEGAARHACRALLECISKLPHIHDAAAVKGYPALKFRAGLNHGECLVGNFGSSQRWNYTALGDNVNIAARLEALNKRYHTMAIVSEAVIKDVAHVLNTPADVDKMADHDFVYRFLESVSLPGKAEPTRVYELMGYRNTTSNSNVQLARAYSKARLQTNITVALHAFNKLVETYPDDYPSEMMQSQLANDPRIWNEAPGLHKDE